MLIWDGVPPRVSIYETSLRDGLQNEEICLPTDKKMQILVALADAGIERAEITSFVSPTWIPQLHDAEALIEQAIKLSNLRLSALCPNWTGLDRAIESGVEEIAVFLSSSNTHNRKNLNKSTEESMAVYRSLLPKALENKLRVRGYVSTVWGCPYEGYVDPDHSQELVLRLLDIGCYEVSLGDTIGVGTPKQTAMILERFLKQCPADRLAMHMHDTRGMAIANVLIGLQYGIRTFDSAIAGLGGCPYAPGASGNLATEDLVYMLDGMGISTGVDLQKLWQAGQVVESIIGRKLPGKVHQAGVHTVASTTKA